MSAKARVNWLIDVVIAVAFIVTAVSGVVFFLGLAGGGFHGGRDPQTEAILLDRATWRSLHEWFGMAMIAGVGLHLVLHWKWILCVTKAQLKTLFQMEGRQPKEKSTLSL